MYRVKSVTVAMQNTESKVGNKGSWFPDQARALQVNPKSPEILTIWVGTKAERRPQTPQTAAVWRFPGAPWVQGCRLETRVF